MTSSCMAFFVVVHGIFGAIYAAGVSITHSFSFADNTLCVNIIYFTYLTIDEYLDSFQL